jgi:NAD(P)-dependent dehydrogenase (short-subunit alcohol dehydrogenase family)
LDPKLRGEGLNCHLSAAGIRLRARSKKNRPSADGREVAMQSKVMKDKVAVITGSTRGFGYAIAQSMLRAGATVMISGRTPAAVHKAVDALRSLGPVHGEACDVREERQVYALAQNTVKKFGRIDIWINNAGSASAAGRIVDTPPQQAMDTFLSNDLGTLYGTQAALRIMMEAGQGTLVNIYGHGSFLRPASPTGMYGASKAWLTSFTRTLAKEIAGSGVQVVGFSPGMLLTDMLTSPTVIGEHGQEMLKNYAFVLRFLGGPAEKAADKLVSFLQKNRKPFAEVRLFKPWTPLFGMLRIGWENITRTGRTPEFELKIEPEYRPEF